MWLIQSFGGETVKLSAHRIDVGEGQRVGVSAVCQEDEYALVLRVDPERRSGESVVAEAIGRQIDAAR